MIIIEDDIVVVRKKRHNLQFTIATIEIENAL